MSNHVNEKPSPGLQRLVVEKVVKVGPSQFQFTFGKSNGKSCKFSQVFDIEEPKEDEAPRIIGCLFDYDAEVKTAHSKVHKGDFSPVLGKPLSVNVCGSGNGVFIKATYHESVARCTQAKAIQNEFRRRGKELPDSELRGYSIVYLESDRILKRRLMNSISAKKLKTKGNSKSKSIKAIYCIGEQEPSNVNKNTLVFSSPTTDGDLDDS